jgi:hypothetical protein
MKNSEQLQRQTKEAVLTLANPNTHTLSTHEEGLSIELQRFSDAEMDKQWSYVGNKSEQRWLWYAIEHATKLY